MVYDDDIKPIPACCLSQENTEVLTRLSNRGYSLQGSLCLPCTQHTDSNSRNIIFDLPGCSTNPTIRESIVLIGAHTDSWECHHESCQGTSLSLSLSLSLPVCVCFYYMYG